MKVGNKNKINDRRFKFEAELVSTLSESVKPGFVQPKSDVEKFKQPKKRSAYADHERK